MRRGYRCFPLNTTALPPGIPYIVGNEAAERFSYYGMRAVLVVYLTHYLVDGAGQPAPMSEIEAQAYFHLFVSATYLTPLLGAFMADVFLGKYRTIIGLSLAYCLGHFVLALDDTRNAVFVGQTLIALGAGGIKPCVSAHVGDQFCSANRNLLARVYAWFYLAINLGAAVSMLITPWLLSRFGASFAFGVPGVLMVVATFLFWLGRWRFAHVPPGGLDGLRRAFHPEARGQLARLAIMYGLISIFWSLFDQTGSSWVLQAAKLDRNVFGYEVLPSQIQAANPFLILLLVPLFGRVVYPNVGRWVRLTPLRKIGFGMVLAAAAFAVISAIQIGVDQGARPSIAWQLLAYLLLTSAEVMVSITGLEFAYTQAPLRIKSLVMALYLASVALGNVVTSAVNFALMTPEGGSRVAGASYFWFFCGLMTFTVLAFAAYARAYREVSYLQIGHAEGMTPAQSA